MSSDKGSNLRKKHARIIVHWAPCTPPASLQHLRTQDGFVSYSVEMTVELDVRGVIQISVDLSHSEMDVIEIRLHKHLFSPNLSSMNNALGPERCRNNTPSRIIRGQPINSPSPHHASDEIQWQP